MIIDNACEYTIYQLLTKPTAEKPEIKLFYTINLVHTLDNGKQHNLQKLFRATRNYSPELAAIFSFNKEEDKRLFEILKRAYVEARYNPDFVVTQEDIDALFPKVEKLRDVVSEVCKAQIESYREMK